MSDWRPFELNAESMQSAERWRHWLIDPEEITKIRPYNGDSFIKFAIKRDIVAAWKAYISKPYSAGMDGTMSQIIGDEPSVRDWYVATSIIQWLATNCGMSVLEAAGFKYDWEKRRG